MRQNQMAGSSSSRGKDRPEWKLPPRRSDHCQFQACFQKVKSGGSPSNGRELFPRRMKEPHCEMGSKKKMAHKKQSNQTGWSTVLTVSVSSKKEIVFNRFLSKIYARKNV
jgi:hypothetical protein